jgi:hypothetical protein
VCLLSGTNRIVKYKYMQFSSLMVVPWLRHLDSEFHTGPIQGNLVADRGTFRQVSLQVLRFSLSVLSN